MPNVAGNRRGGTYSQMQAVLDSQQAVNEQTRQAMRDISIAMNGILQSMDVMFNPLAGPSFNRVGGGLPGGVGFGGGHGARPGRAPSPYDNPYMFHGRGISGIRHTLARAIHQRFGTPSGSTYQNQYDQQGNIVGIREYKPDGSYADHAPGSIDPAAIRGSAARDFTSRAMGGLAEGGMLGAARAIPYVGAAMLGAEAVHEGLTFVANQRAANAYYQNIYGGSNISGLGQRFQQFGFQLGNLFEGGLPWDQSAQAFKAVSSLGFQGTQRQNDLNFITSNYKQMGLSVADSFKLIDIASKDMNVSLDKLQQGLKDTRDAAVATGQAASTGTQIFTQTYANLAQNYSTSYAGGAGIQGVAGILASAQANLGRYLSGQLDFSQMLGMQNIPRLAAAAGVGNLSQMIGDIQSGSPATYRGLNTLLARGVAPTLANNRVQQFISTFARNNGGVGAIRNNPDQISQLANELMSNARRLGLNAWALPQQIESATGLHVNTPEAALELLARQAVGGRAFTPPKPVAPNRAAGNFTTTGAGDSTMLGFDPNRSGVNRVIDDARKRLAGKNVEVETARGRRVVSIDTAIKYYPDQIGKGTAIVEGTGGQSVAESLGERQKRVITTAGGDSGPSSAIYDYNGFSNKDIVTNFNSTKLGNIGKAGTDEDSLGSEQGMTPAAYGKLQRQKARSAGSGTAGVSGTVTINPSPELKALLHFSTSGNVQIANEGAANNSVYVPGS